MSNFIEELVSEYYKTKGYFVTTNYWLPFQTERKRIQNGAKQKYTAQSWTDIDVMAMNNKELLLIQVKSLINQKLIAEKINLHFERVEQYLDAGIAPDGKSKIDWWKSKRKIKKIVIYEDKMTPPSYLKIIKDGGIETKFFGDYFNELIDYVQTKKGVKEETSVMRLMHYLNNQKMLEPKK
jgi:hypothetical protein